MAYALESAWEEHVGVVEGRGPARSAIADDVLGTMQSLTGGMRMVPGTLDLRIDRPILASPRWVIDSGNTDRGERADQPSYRMWTIQFVGEIPGVALLPNEGIYPADQIAVVSSVDLRSILGLEDGDRVRFYVLG